MVTAVPLLLQLFKEVKLNRWSGKQT